MSCTPAPTVGETPGLHRVFTYGTLKKGQPNFYRFEESGHGNAKHIGTGRTVTEYPLVVATKWNLPFLLFAPGKGHNVTGDIFEVDDDMMVWMDEFEGHPEVYQRMKVDIALDSHIGNQNGCLQDGPSTKVECWVYILPRFPDVLFTKTMLKTYDAYLHKDHEYKVDEDLAGPDNIQEALLNG